MSHESPQVRSSASSGPNCDADLGIGDCVAARYELVDHIGSGGMGTVFGAFDRRLKRPVALKIIRRHLAAEASVAARFHREALASSRLSHPNVVTVHDFGTAAEGSSYLVMERLRGEPLSRAIRGSTSLPWRRAASVASDIARALVAAHAASIVHRDLKPANVFITDRGSAKVLDFGVAKMLDSERPDEPSLTTTGMLIGTPLYMSPEAIRAGDTVGAPADLYALGAMLFRMLTGQAPFMHSEPVIVLSMHVQRAPPSARTRQPDLAIPAELDELVVELLAKSPHERPTAEEVLRRLEQMLAADAPAEPHVLGGDRSGAPLDPLEATSNDDFHEAPTALRASTAPPPQEARRPSRLALISVSAATVLVALVAGLSAYGLTQARRPTPERLPAGAEAPAGLREAPPIPRPTRTKGTSSEASAEAAHPVAPVEVPIEAAVAALQSDPATPVEVPTGQLSVRSSVPARVSIDGEDVGTTPADVTLPVGAHRIALRAGDTSRTLLVRIEPGQTTRRTVRSWRASPASEPPRAAERTTTRSGLELPSEW